MIIIVDIRVLIYPSQTSIISYTMFLGYGKRPRHMRSKTWDASNGRASPTSPNGMNVKKQTAPYGPKKDREAFRRALVGIIRCGSSLPGHYFPRQNLTHFIACKSNHMLS